MSGNEKSAECRPAKSAKGEPTVQTRSKGAGSVTSVAASNAQTENLPHELQGDDIDMEVLNNIGTKTMYCQSIHRRISEFRRGGSPFSSILLQIDGHDEILRVHGDATWKLCMGVVAEAIRDRLRQMDMVALYDDLTFGLVMPDASLREAVCIGERLRKTVENTSVQVNGHTLQFTVSLGIVEVAEEDELATLVARVRQQLEQVQSGGGNRTGFSAQPLVAS